MKKGVQYFSNRFINLDLSRVDGATRELQSLAEHPGQGNRLRYKQTEDVSISEQHNIGGLWILPWNGPAYDLPTHLHCQYKYSP